MQRIVISFLLLLTCVVGLLAAEQPVSSQLPSSPPAVVLPAVPQVPDERAVLLTLHVDIAHVAAADTNVGSNLEQPLRSIAAAVAKASGQPTRIRIHPGTYREYVRVAAGNELLILEAEKPGTVILSGSEIYSNWSVEGEILSHLWTKSWGLGNENAWWGSTAFNRRREMVFVDGKALQQVCDEAGKPLAAAALQAGQFTVTDATADAAGRIQLRLPSASVAATAVIEVAERGFESGYIHDSRPLLEITGHSNVVLRGLTVQHCANYIKFGPAISFVGGYPGDYEKLPKNVLVEDCVVRWNNAIGMEISNYREVLVRRSHFDFNGERGAGSVQLGTEPDKRVGVPVGARNFRVEDCTFNDNNWRMVGTWGDMNDAAGWKQFGHNIDAYTFIRCQFNRNLANGFWQDYGGSNVIIDRCLLEDNRGGSAGGYGVLNEMSRGPFTVSRSVIRRNGNSGFIASGAPNVALLDSWLYHNTQDVQHVGQRLYGHEIKINSDTGRDSADFIFGLSGWTIRGCTIAGFGNPIGKGSLFMITGADFPSGRNPAAEFAYELTSDHNTFSKDDQERDYFPGRKVLYSIGAKPGAPDLELPAWQAQRNRHGQQDQHSRFVYPLDLTGVADPTQPREK